MWVIDYDGGGFELIPNENGIGCKTSPESNAAFKKWAEENPPPNDGHRYMASALYPRWVRY